MSEYMPLRVEERLRQVFCTAPNEWSVTSRASCGWKGNVFNTALKPVIISIHEVSAVKIRSSSLRCIVLFQSIRTIWIPCLSLFLCLWIFIQYRLATMAGNGHGTTYSVRTQWYSVWMQSRSVVATNYCVRKEYTMFSFPSPTAILSLYSCSI